METEKEEQKKKKLSIGTTILIVVLILINVGLVGFICYDKGRESLKNSNEPSKTNTENDESKDTDHQKVKELDLSKCLNTNAISYSNASDTTQGNYGLSMNINSDKKTIALSIDWNQFGPISSASAWSSDIENYQITGFSKNVVHTFIGEIGQDAKGVTLFYLMEDGTVEYTPMFDQKSDNQGNYYYGMNYTYDYSGDGKITGEHFVTKGTINGVSDVIKLYNVAASSGAGWSTTIGAKADGSFYDLGNIISK